MKRDFVWSAIDAAMTLAVLSASVAVRNLWLWLVAFAWAALTIRQLRLSVHARRLANGSTK